ncbi:MAG TPA: hypothetical protein V6C58_19720 [Allocoleopsis sp.]
MREKFFTILDRINTEILPKLKIIVMGLYHYYELNITQKKIAQNLSIEQYQVSREMNRAKKKYLPKCVNYMIFPQ